jgi:TPR repeat protein
VPAHYKLGICWILNFSLTDQGVCYECGISVEKSDEKAVEHYKLAANKGNVNARYNLGN